jgi:hypothetical protein
MLLEARRHTQVQWQSKRLLLSHGDIPLVAHRAL